MTKYWVTILFIFSALVGCDGIKHHLMQDAPEGACGNASFPEERTPERKKYGKALFMANCAACHHPIKDATGPALRGAWERWDNDTARLYAFIRNPKRMIRKDAYARALHRKWQVNMPGYPLLTSAEISAILDYTAGGY